MYYIGPKEKYAAELLKKENVIIKKILAGKIRRYFSLKNIIDFFKIPIGTIQSFFWLFFLAPDIVFSKGGYGSFPVVLAAKSLEIPIFLHESDSIPGKSSQITAKWAIEVFVSFIDQKIFPKEKIVCVGNPIRREITEGLKENAKKTFGIQGDKPVILFLGGSQGAQKINGTILEILPELLEDFEVVHQTGEKNLKNVQIEAGALIGDKDIEKRYHVLAFLKEKQYAEAFAVSDLVVSRAGSGSIFEIAGCGKPAIIIPLPDSAQDHQIKNAYEFEKSEGGEVIEQKNMTPNFLLEKIKNLFSRPDILAEMAKKSIAFSRPRTGEIIASYLVEYLKAMKK